MYNYLEIWIFVFIKMVLGQLGEPLYTFSACHGITLDSFVTPQCNSSSIILPVRVIAAAKTNSSGCPLIAEDTSVTASCCVYNSSDCRGEYAVLNDPSASVVYHTECIGLESCTRGRQAATMDTWYLNCSSSDVYLERTNYMYMEYHCIPESRIGTIPLAEVNATNEPVYLLGQTYPSPISNTTATCSVQTDDCYAIITMYIVDLRLYNDSVGCTQTLDVSGITLTCADNNNFEIRPVTRSSYMRIKFDSSVTNQGFFWVGFQSTSSSMVTVSCPAQEPVCATGKQPGTSAEGSENEGLHPGAWTGIGVTIYAVVQIIAILIIHSCKNTKKDVQLESQNTTASNSNDANTMANTDYPDYLQPGFLPQNTNTQLAPISHSLK